VTGSAGQLMTIATGSFTVTRGPSPSYTVVSAGSTGVTLGVLNLRATNEELSLQKIRFQLTSSASSTSADFVGNQVTLWDGATQIGTAVFAGSGTVATSTLTSTLVLPKDADKLITIKADVSAQGVSQPGTRGALIKVDYDGGCVSCTTALGSSSGVVNSSTATDTAFDGVKVFKSYPTFAKLSVPSTVLVTGTTMDLYRFSVKAASAGSGIGIYKFTVNIATSSTPGGTSSTTVTNLKVLAYTDSSFSSPASGFSPAGQLNDTTAGLLSSGNTDILMTASTQGVDYLQVPYGLTYYFRVVGDITMTGAVTGATVVTNLQGDANYPAFASGTTFQLAQAASTTVFTNGDGDDFIWSPNSTTTSVVTADDWTNGYFVAGLPADNLDAQALSK
ncbi:MAG: hypothetical protein AAB706_04415, partial [Patescibacteria group bacterium]